MSSTERSAGANRVEVEVGVAVNPLIGIQGRSDAEVRKDFTHRSAEETHLPGLRREGEVFHAPPAGGGVLHELANRWSAAEVFGQVHREHVACTVIGDALIPPSDGLLGRTGPRIHVPRQGGIRPEAEVDGDVSVALVDPQVLVRIQGVVEQVFKFVSEDGTTP